MTNFGMSIAIVKLIIKYEGQAPGDDRWACVTHPLLSRVSGSQGK